MFPPSWSELVKRVHSRPVVLAQALLVVVPIGIEAFEKLSFITLGRFLAVSGTIKLSLCSAILFVAALTWVKLRSPTVFLNFDSPEKLSEVIRARANSHEEIVQQDLARTRAAILRVIISRLELARAQAEEFSRNIDEELQNHAGSRAPPGIQELSRDYHDWENLDRSRRIDRLIIGGFIAAGMVIQLALLLSRVFTVLLHY